MPKLKLSRPNPGGIEMMEWLDQGSGQQVIEELDDTIQPSQDMSPFQQRRFWFNDAQIIAVGERVTWIVVVPVKEAWEIDHITYLTTDSVGHSIEISWTAPLAGTFPRMILTRKLSQTFQNLNLFPTRNLEGDLTGPSEFEFTGRLKLGPGERLIIQSITDAGGAATERLTIRGHNIPIPVTQRERTGLITATVA